MVFRNTGRFALRANKGIKMRAYLRNRRIQRKRAFVFLNRNKYLVAKVRQFLRGNTFKRFNRRAGFHGPY